MSSSYNYECSSTGKSRTRRYGYSWHSRGLRPVRTRLDKPSAGVIVPVPLPVGRLGKQTRSDTEFGEPVVGSRTHSIRDGVSRPGTIASEAGDSPGLADATRDRSVRRSIGAIGAVTPRWAALRGPNWLSTGEIIRQRTQRTFVRTLRVKLVIPERTSRREARAVFEELSEIHEDQAIFQINRTEYLDDDGWGFRIQYDTKLYVKKEFIQSRSLAAIERVMARVALESFERRIDRPESE